MECIPPGVWVILVLAAASLVVAPMLESGKRADGKVMWTFALMHRTMYAPILNEWNRTHDEDMHVELRLLGIPALERRMMSGFLSEIPTADLIEAERSIAPRAFAGPLESVGFLDLTDRIRAEGLDEAINPPSFIPWMSRGRIFGLPHDVHPMMLAYRSDIVEAAGIDVDAIETWDDFAREFARVQTDANNDGTPDRFALNFWPTQVEALEALLLQAGGGFFDAEGRSIVACPENVMVLARMGEWMAGPTRIAADAQEFTAMGNQMKLDGQVCASVMPDWLADIWKTFIPQLEGKMKLMPLPAWEPGGRRTSAWGGSMLGIAKSAPDHDALWEFAKTLYLSDEVARALWREGDIISPIRSHWSDPMYDEPDPYFSMQPKGRMLIDLADQIPPRASSPFGRFAQLRVQDALYKLLNYRNSRPDATRAEMEAKAAELLANADAQVRRQMSRNRFVGGGS